MTRIAEPTTGTADRRDIAVIHVRFAGRSFDLRLGRYGLQNGSSDQQVKQRVAEHLEVPPHRLADYVIDRHVNGNLTLRPQAVFG
jgi:hypothetical protein